MRVQACRLACRACSRLPRHLCLWGRPSLSSPLTNGFTVSWVLPTLDADDSPVTGMFLKVVDGVDGAVVAEVRLHARAPAAGLGNMRRCNACPCSSNRGSAASVFARGIVRLCVWLRGRQIPVSSATVSRADLTDLPFGRLLAVCLRYNSLAGAGDWSEPSVPIRTLGPLTHAPAVSGCVCRTHRA
jgi:hypothetical protein